jgi:hypothetical protein
MRELLGLLFPGNISPRNLHHNALNPLLAAIQGDISGSTIKGHSKKRSRLSLSIEVFLCMSSMLSYKQETKQAHKNRRWSRLRQNGTKHLEG